MINFTGHTKRRVVNLGNKSTFGTNVSYLDQQRIQRQQREELRQRERAASILQSGIRRYLELTQVAREFAEEWVVESQNVNSDRQFTLWLYKFGFISKWYLPTTYDESLLTLLYQKLQSHESSITFEQFRLVLNALVGLRKYKLYHQSTLQCINLLLSNPNPRFFPGVEGTYPNLIEGLKEIDSPPELIFQVNINDSYHSFLQYISKPLPDIPTQALSTLREVLPDANLNDLNNNSLVNLLNNYLNICEFNEFSMQDLSIIGNLLSNITCSIKLKEENRSSIDDDDDDDDDVDDDEYYDEIVYVDPSTLQNIQKLYNSKFIKRLIEGDSNINIIAALFNLIPQSKSKLCMTLTITSGTFTKFYDQIRTYPAYNALFHASGDYLKQEQISRLQNGDIDKFWRLLYIFAELLSYWLIVSTDVESFNDEKLSTSQAIDIARLFKTLSLTLIFVDLPNSKNLKTISITLLNQFYMKNLRMKFLPGNFFIPRELKFNIDSLLHLVAQEEEKRVDMQELDDMEKSTKAKSTVDLSKTDLGCKLEVLNKLPFFINFKDRVRIFQTLIELDRQRLPNESPYAIFSFMPPSKMHADIRREHVLEDAFENFHTQGPNFKNKLDVSFFNEYGGQEAGIDGGGITKEFLTSVIAEGFNPKTGLFKETADNQLYPNEEIYEKLNKKIDIEEQKKKLLYLRFLGGVMGKCFYENVLIDVSFAPFFLGKWCNSNMKNSINDLNYLDMELYNNLMKLIQMSSQQLSYLDLNFTIDQVLNGETYTFEIIPQGKAVKVDQTNKLNYIHQISNFKLNASLHVQTKYFLDGLYEMIDSAWLNMFDPFELQMLISGGVKDVNVDDWKENVEYGGYIENDLTIQLFWEVVEEMTGEERCKLIKFVTSVSRAPLLGFGSLSPRFGIRNSGRYLDRLPTASTCVNLLKLPDYRNKKLIREKLLYSINNGAGFEMS